MTETFSACKLAKEHDNISGLTNIETIAVDGRYFPVVDDLDNWSYGAVLRGDGITRDQGYASTAWKGAWITHAQWLYLYQTILRNRRSGEVTIQTRRYDPARWVICNAILDIGAPPAQSKMLDYYRPFVWRFTRIQVLEEQRMYGAIYTKDGSTAQADITTTPVLLTGFAANGESSGVTASYTADSLTVGYGGVWLVSFSIDATATASQQYKFNVRVNAVESVHQCEFSTNATPDKAHTSITNMPLDLDANDVVTMYVETDDADAGTSLTPINMHFSLTSASLDN